MTGPARRPAALPAAGAVIPGGPLVVWVSAPPNPFLLRRVISDRLAGRPVIPGPEAAVAQAVASWVSEARQGAGQSDGSGSCR